MTPWKKYRQNREFFLTDIYLGRDSGANFDGETLLGKSSMKKLMTALIVAVLCSVHCAQLQGGMLIGQADIFTAPGFHTRADSLNATLSVDGTFNSSISFGGLKFTASDVGRTFYSNTLTDAQFGILASYMSNGSNDTLDFLVGPPGNFGSGGVSRSESSLFSSRPPGGVDFAHYSIDRLGLRINSLSFNSPGRDFFGDHNWTDVSLGASILVYGSPLSRLASTILNNAVTWHIDNGRIYGVFTPNGGLTLEEAAKALGFDHFNWIQTITNVSERDLLLPGFQDMNGRPPSIYRDGRLVPFFDPVAGGYAYEGASPGHPVEDALPYYWDELFHNNLSVSTYTNNSGNIKSFDMPRSEEIDLPDQSLLFYDRPSTPSGDRIDFTTSLAGVRSDGSSVVLNFAGNDIRWFEQGGHEAFLPNTSIDTTGMTVSNGLVAPNGFTNAELNTFADSGIATIGPSAVPEPSTLISGGIAAVALSGLAWRRRKRA